MKTCTKCRETKPLSEFYWSKPRGRHESQCKQCTSARTLAYRSKHLERIKEAQREWQAQNPDRTRAAGKRYRTRHPEAVSLAQRKCRAAVDPLRTAARALVWRDRNREHLRTYMREYYRKGYGDRRRKRPTDRIGLNLRSRLRVVLRAAGAIRTARTEALVGCTISELRARLEAQFRSGMSWDNYGVHGWHIDHIRPCASFDLTDPEQQRACFHWANLQPLWATENIAKGARVT